MSLSQPTLDAGIGLTPIRRGAGWAVARFVLGLRSRPARLVEEKAPDWQLRDLGLRDGRVTMARMSRLG